MKTDEFCYLLNSVQKGDIGHREEVPFPGLGNGIFLPKRRHLSAKKKASFAPKEGTFWANRRHLLGK
jgi:hypothetical protein